MEQRKGKTIKEVILCEILCENEIMWENSKSNQLLAQRMVGLAHIKVPCTKWSEMKKNLQQFSLVLPPKN